tara:strand:+ start:875 stop:1369 length:495 start_codon:yes stop_codon:yes gene_type:complete
MSKDDKWDKAQQPPPPMFLGEKERNFVKQINDEIIERVVGQQVLYFPLDIEHTNYHPLYGEAVEKTFLPPVRVFALVEYQGVETNFLEGVGLDKTTKISIKFHKRRLTEDQDLYIREGDFVRYGDIYYEIVKLIEPKLLFGQPEHRFEIQADCIRARDGLFNAS